MSTARRRAATALGGLALLLTGFGAARGQGPHYDTYDDYARAVTGGDPVRRVGMDTWFLWTAGDQAFWGRAFPVVTRGQVDLLRLLDNRVLPRALRLKALGVINDPGTLPGTGTDAYGFVMDQPAEPMPPGRAALYGESTGIIGLRRFPNPYFDKDRWAAAGGAAGYLARTGAKFDPSLQPPYLIGMACAACHVAFDPLNPPADPRAPRWENLAPAIGNQYLKEGALFSGGALPNEFRYQAGLTQEPGTSDTSRIPDDFLNNPTAINPVFGLAARFKIRTYEEVSPGQAAFLAGMPAPIAADLKPGPPPRMLTAHGLMDGADSVGLAMGSLRVYSNIGGFEPNLFLKSIPSAANGYTQTPFDVVAARNLPNGAWKLTEQFATPMQEFLAGIGRMPLAQAPGGRDYLRDAPGVVRRGALVFADNCASCHSSKQPAPSITNPALRKVAMRELVLSPDFLDNNFLSDDRRYPQAEIGTNAARTAGTNAMAGQIWASFSSQTYKDLPPGATTAGLYNPLDPRSPVRLKLPEGGPGYYRTSTLIAMWATAPYLHNNSVGEPTDDPSVDGRMRAFEDGVVKLLWPELRGGRASVKRTSAPSILTDNLGDPVMVPGANGSVPFVVPAGTPVNLLANLRPNDLPAVAAAYARGGPPAALQAALKFNLCPDFIEDGGHLYGCGLSAPDKRALIAYLKRL